MRLLVASALLLTLVAVASAFPYPDDTIPSEVVYIPEPVVREARAALAQRGGHYGGGHHGGGGFGGGHHGGGYGGYGHGGYGGGGYGHHGGHHGGHGGFGGGHHHFG